jgi:hypothetical protein
MRFDVSQIDMGTVWEDEEDGERTVTYGPDRRFIGRFKYANATLCAEHFVEFLVENFEVEEYFGLLAGGMAPATALETKGFIDYNTRQAMIRGGHATREELLAATRAAFEARRAA